jgi:hypothetical protein
VLQLVVERDHQVQAANLLPEAVGVLKDGQRAVRHLSSLLSGRKRRQQERRW